MARYFLLLLLLLLPLLVAAATLAVTSALPTLNSIKDLDRTGFGRPPPHHGLRLLRWYVKKCLDNNMVALCDPAKRQYGFHPFRNREALLPRLRDERRYGYYTVGNLNLRGAKDLPDDVRRDYNRSDPLSNMDRVLVKFNRNNRHIDEIFISAHYAVKNTFIIGPNLLSLLRQKLYAEWVMAYDSWF